MKKLVVILFAFIFLYSCRHNERNISISYRDKEEFYSMDARFSKSKTRRAERYLNEIIGRENNISFFNTRTDAVLTLDNGTKFYLKKNPGHIFIKINKGENSGEAVHEMKIMCEGMKGVLLK